MSAAQLDFYYDMDDDLGLSQSTATSSVHNNMAHHSHHHHMMSSAATTAATSHSHLAHNLTQSHPQSAYTTPDLYIYSNYPAHSTSHVTSDARDNRHFTPYSNSSSNASSTSVDCVAPTTNSQQGDSPRSTQLLTQPIPSSSASQVLTPTTSITSSALTTPTSTLTSPPTSATYPLPSMPRKRSVEFISHEISNSSGAPLVLSQPPKRNNANKRHVSDVGLVPSSSEPIYYYSNLVSPATETYDEYSTGTNGVVSSSFDSIQEENHTSSHQSTPQTGHVTSHPVMWNPAYTVLPSQQKVYHSRDRHNSDYSYDYGYEQMRRVSESGSDSRKTSETGSSTSEHVATSGFINYTQRDGPKLMTGVAPSGAQKTKQKREAEARRREAERREKEKGYY